MAYAYTIYSAGSSQTDYTISWPYIKEEHVKVYVNFVDTSFTFHNATTARLASAPASGTRVEVRRVTPPSAVLVDYADGSTLTASDLDTSNLQHLYIAQELDDNLKKGVSISTSTGLPTLGSKKLTEVADPTAAQDAATKNYVDTQDATKQPLDAELTELATMASNTAAALADLTQAEVQLVDGATLTTTELNYVDGVTSAIQTQIDGKQPLDADLTSLSSCQSGSAVNLALLTSGEVAVLDGATLSTAELNTLTGITSTAAELNKLDGVSSTTANLNVVSGMTKATTLTSNSDTEFPTSKAVNDRILTVTNALGGFVAIANETSFPATNPDPSDGAGTVVSISDAGGVVVNGSGVASITNGAGTGNTVTINGFPSALQSKTLASGIGLQVQTTTTLHTYTYHKVLAKEADVEQLSSDIDDFKARYRVTDGLPNSDNDEGDLVYNKSTDKMMVYDSTTSAFKEVQSIGSFNFNTLSSYNGTGGNSASFDGTAHRFVLSNPPSFAQQLICSVNGVVQKPNAGTSQPSEGFAIDGSSIIFSAAPASNAPFFIITLGSAVNVGSVSDGAITEAKLSVGNSPTNGKFLQAQSGQTGGLFWADVSSTPEGTAILSTGESGTTKFLRIDGDGTCSWQVPPDTVYTHPNHSGEVTSTADGATVIASDIVDEDNLKVSNSPTNGYFLSAQSGNTGGLTWAAAGGANVLQVKMATQGNSDIQSSFSSQTLTDMLSVTITPTATSSKFLVFANYRGYKNGAAILTLNTGLVRNVNGGAFTELYAKNWDPVLQYTDNNAKSVHSNHFYLDAPSYSSGNALIYKSQAASGNGDSIDVGRFTELLVIELASGTAP